MDRPDRWRKQRQLSNCRKEDSRRCGESRIGSGFELENKFKEIAMPCPPLSAVSEFFNYATRLLHQNQMQSTDKVHDFFHHFVSLLKKKRENDRFEASDFNVFDYIQPNELKLSRIIADLLNPKDTHGQQITFLTAFVEAMMEGAPKPLQETLIKLQDAIQNNICAIRVKTEQKTLLDKRSMDIWVDLDGKNGIVIENKPWANDQKEQLKDYAKDAKKRFPDGWVLIYLHGGGKAADEYTLPNKEDLKRSGNYLDADYAYFLIRWLNNCLNHAKAEKVCVFLREFISYVEEEFKNGFYQETTDA